MPHAACMFDDSAATLAPNGHDQIVPATSRSPLIARRDAFDKGFSADDIKRRIARREWIVVRPGTYLQAARLPSLSPLQRHLLQVDAELPRASGDAVVSHLSAACEHGIDLVNLPGKTVHVTNPSGFSGHRRPLLHTRIANIDDDEWIMLRGHRVTTVSRTVVDIARTRPFEEGAGGRGFRPASGSGHGGRVEGGGEPGFAPGRYRQGSPSCDVRRWAR